MNNPPPRNVIDPDPVPLALAIAVHDRARARHARQNDDDDIPVRAAYRRPREAIGLTFNFTSHPKGMTIAQMLWPSEQFVQDLQMPPRPNHRILYAASIYVTQLEPEETNKHAFLVFVIRMLQLFNHYTQGDIPQDIMVRILNNVADWFLAEGRKPDYGLLYSPLWPQAVAGHWASFAPSAVMDILSTFPCHDGRPRLPRVTGVPFIPATALTVSENQDPNEQVSIQTRQVEIRVQEAKQKTEKERRKTIDKEQSERRRTIVKEQSEKRLTAVEELKVEEAKLKVEAEKRLTAEQTEAEKRLTAEKTESQKRLTAKETESQKRLTEAEKRATIDSQAAADIRKLEAQSIADLKKLELQIKLEQVRQTPMKALPPQVTEQLPVVAPSPLNNLAVPTFQTPARPTLPQPSMATMAVPTESTTAKKKRNGGPWGYETIVTFPCDGFSNMPLPSFFETYLEGTCDSGHHFNTTQTRPLDVEKEDGTTASARTQTWRCGCGGATLRIVRVHGSNVCSIQRPEGKSKEVLRFHKKQDGSRGQRLEAKKD